MATTSSSFSPPIPSTTTTTSSTTTSTACTSTIVSNSMSLSGYKGIAMGIPSFSFYVSSSNRHKVRPTGFRIKDLPSAGDGILYLNNVAVTDEQVIAPADNGKLVYVPATDADSAASFTFAVETNCGNGSTTTITLAITEKPDDDGCNCSTSTTSSTSTTTL